MMKKLSVETCVICGEPVPEGMQVCPKCVSEMNRYENSKQFVRDKLARKQESRKRRKERRDYDYEEDYS